MPGRMKKFDAKTGVAGRVLLAANDTHEARNILNKKC